MNSKIIIQLAFLLVAAAAINWYLDSTEQDQDSKAINKNEPDLYMSNASLTQFSSIGRMQHQIRAARFTHYPEQDVTTLSMPLITVHKNEGPPWIIRSRAGRILPDSEHSDLTMELWRSVLVERTHQKGQFINIRTENLTVIPDLDYAETDQTVIIDNNTGRTTASGMKADLKKGKFVFFSDGSQRVNTIILPESDQI